MPSSGVKNRFFRVYDGGSPRKYVQFIQIDQVAFPLITPRPTTAIMADGGRATDYMDSYIEDETVPFQPIEVTLKLLHLSNKLQLLDALGNPLNKASWVIGSDTWVGLATNAIGTRKNSDGVSVACRYPRDSQQVNRMVSCVTGYTVPTDAPGGRGLFSEAKGVVVTNVMDSPDGQNMFFEITLQIWGEVNPGLTGWPVGVESIPV